MRHPVNRVLMIPLLLATALGAAIVSAHSGGMDKNGCHIETKTGERHCHQKRKFDLSQPAHPGDDGVLYGPLVRAIDGDTLVVKIQGAEMQFRLAGIDAPEADQSFGAEARAALVEIIGSQSCVMRPVEPDIYGRTVVHLWIGDTYVNEELVRRGMAWFDSRYVWSDALFDTENDARDARRGLWKLPPAERIEPWVWRKDKH